MPMTLKSVFEDMQLDAYDLNVDILDVHAVSDMLNLYLLFAILLPFQYDL